MITILSRLRNEELVLLDFLNHIDKIGDEFMFFDDCSTDNSVEILRSHPKTKIVLRNYFHNTDQSFVQTAQRNLLLNYAKIESNNDWILWIEPDERIENIEKIKDIIKECEERNVSGVYFKLLDGYIAEDKQIPYENGELENIDRKWGIERRDIVFLFNKKFAHYNLAVPGCRQPIIKGETIISDTWVKHFGKCLSIEQWEETCEYYSKSMPSLAKKWNDRRGKAIHEKSDFDTPLYSWEEAKLNSKKI